jgi:hypothetical protein
MLVRPLLGGAEGDLLGEILEPTLLATLGVRVKPSEEGALLGAKLGLAVDVCPTEGVGDGMRDGVRVLDGNLNTKLATPTP